MVITRVFSGSKPPIKIINRLFGSEKALINRIYRNDPKFLDRYVLANSADPDQTAP